MFKGFKKWNEAILLDVQGTFMSTSRTTLNKVKDSKLCNLISGQQPIIKKDERYYLDRNPKIF